MAAEDLTSADALIHEASRLVQARRHAGADERLQTAPAAVRKTPAWALLQAVVHTRLGRNEPAFALLWPLSQGPQPWAGEALAALADLLHFTERPDELRALLAANPAWTQTPRGQLFGARLLMRPDPEQALAALLKLVQARPGSDLQRIAGFDAVRLLDRLGRYREAFDLATRLHSTTPVFDLGGFLARMRLQQRLLAKGAAWCPWP